MFGLDGEGIVRRARALATEHANRRGLPATATDDALRTAIGAVQDLVARDRRLRRPLGDPGVRSVVDTLVSWEVVLAAVGKEAAEDRWLGLMGRDRTPGPSDGTAPADPVPGTAGPTAPARPARSVRRRPRRLPDVAVHPDLAEAVRSRASDDGDPMHRDGYEHDLWLEEWLELAVGSEAFARIETAVAVHPLVDVARHVDREVLYVAAPSLHPDDVRQVVLAVLTDTFDPDRVQQL